MQGLPKRGAVYRLDSNTGGYPDTKRSLAGASGMAGRARHDDCVVVTKTSYHNAMRYYCTIPSATAGATAMTAPTIRAVG
jgi:hypothetical protein